MDGPILMNPLLNEVVLQVLFEHLDTETLKVVRLVHTSWAKKSFSQLRKSSVVKMSNAETCAKFFNSDIQDRYFRFGFEIRDCAWNQDVLKYFKEIQPSYLNVNFYLNLEEGEFNNIQLFSDLLREFSKRIQKLILTIDWSDESELQLVDEELLNLRYPILKCFAVRNKYETPVPYIPLLKEIVSHSPKLTEIECNIQDDEFWNVLPKVQNLHLETLIIPKVTPHIINKCIMIPKLNIKKLVIQFDPTEIQTILSRFSSCLEHLGFYTPKESALSPIDFPVMHRLKVLDAGRSQLSFPSIRQEKLPHLESLYAVYWDWVYTFEDLPPDIHYYWQTYHPHGNITSFELTFPDTSEISGNYVHMENYPDFAIRLKTKFVNLTNIRLKNVLVTAGCSCVSAITDAFGPQLKELTILSYSPNSISDSSVLFSSLSSCTNLEILDFNPQCWSLIRKRNKEYKSIDVELFYETLAPLIKLKLLKLPFIEKFSILSLFGDQCENFPHLTTLGIVGGRCITRFHKANLKNSRPSLKLSQYECFCSEEDSWYVNDKNSHLTFRNLFIEFHCNSRNRRNDLPVRI